MSIVYGFFATGSADRDPGILSRLERQIDAPGVDEAVLNHSNFVLRRRVPDRLAADAITGITLDGVSIAIVGRPLMRPDADLDIARIGRSELGARLRALDGYWLAFSYDENDRSLEVECDQLGVAWLYWASVPGGVAFSSDFGALARCLPKHPRLNDDACLLTLTLTYPMGDSTCFEEIRIVSPGSALQFFQGRTSERRLPRPEYGDRWVGASLERKFSVLDEALDASYHAWSRPSGSIPWAVALSSGNDSRYGLGLLLRHGQQPSCATFGLPGSTDVKGAMAICRREGLRHELFSTRRQTSWEAWSDAIQRLGVVSGFQYVAGWGHDWRRTLGALGGQVVLGYLGDALSGRHLVDNANGDWFANWIAWSIDMRDDGGWTGSDMLRPEVRKQATELARAAFLRECDGVRFAFAHQKALHLDLFGRQRRIAASQVNFLSDELPVAPLFYTRGMLDFWSNLNYEEHKGQTLYLEYANTRFPALFHRRRPPSLVRRARGTLANFVVTLSPRLKPYLTPPEIDSRALLGQHLDRAQRLVRKNGEAVSHVVDVDALKGQLDRFRRRGSPNAQPLQRFLHLLLLVEACLQR